MSEQGNGSETPRQFVLDTSVAVKWYLPEELHEEAVGLLRLAEAGDVELLAPGTVQPELFNALWWHHRRENLPLDQVRSSWERFALDPVALYAPEDLMPRAAEIALQIGVIIYDALFLALAEDSETVIVSADGKLLKALQGTIYACLAHPLAGINSLVSDQR